MREIRSKQDFLNIVDGENYILQTDLVLQSYDLPVSDSLVNVDINGNEHTITIQRPENPLFNTLRSSSSISNVNVVVSDRQFAPVICSNNYAVIRDLSVSINQVCRDFSGGLVCDSNHSVINNCSVTVINLPASILSSEISLSGISRLTECGIVKNCDVTIHGENISTNSRIHGVSSESRSAALINNEISVTAERISGLIRPVSETIEDTVVKNLVIDLDLTDSRLDTHFPCIAKSITDSELSVIELRGKISDIDLVYGITSVIGENTTVRNINFMDFTVQSDEFIGLSQINNGKIEHIKFDGLSVTAENVKIVTRNDAFVNSIVGNGDFTYSDSCEIIENNQGTSKNINPNLTLTKT